MILDQLFLKLEEEGQSNLLPIKSYLENGIEVFSFILISFQLNEVEKFDVQFLKQYTAMIFYSMDFINVFMQKQMLKHDTQELKASRKCHSLTPILIESSLSNQIHSKKMFEKVFFCKQQ